MHPQNMRHPSADWLLVWDVVGPSIPNPPVAASAFNGVVAALKVLIPMHSALVENADVFHGQTSSSL